MAKHLRPFGRSLLDIMVAKTGFPVCMPDKSRKKSKNNLLGRTESPTFPFINTSAIAKSGIYFLIRFWERGLRYVQTWKQRRLILTNSRLPAWPKQDQSERDSETCLGSL